MPAFGIISTTISTNSNKPIFGQYGSLFSIIVWIMQQTICRNAINCYINLLLLDTRVMWKYIISFLVKILVIMDNPQITKARSENYKPGIIKFLGLRMWVGISEAIRLLPTSLSKKIKDLIFAVLQYFIRLEKGYFLMKSLKYSALASDSYPSLTLAGQDTGDN